MNHDDEHPHASVQALTLGGCCCAHVGAVEGLATRYDRLGVVWFDAHGDLNTPETSPSGNVWGMPLRRLLDSGMDVIDLDGQAVGVVKRRRVLDFLVARPLKRDVYVPFSAIAGGNGRELRLSVASDSVGSSGWARSPLFNRPR